MQRAVAGHVASVLYMIPEVVLSRIGVFHGNYLLVLVADEERLLAIRLSVPRGRLSLAQRATGAPNSHGFCVSWGGGALGTCVQMTQPRQGRPSYPNTNRGSYSTPDLRNSRVPHSFAQFVNEWENTMER